MAMFRILIFSLSLAVSFFFVSPEAEKWSPTEENAPFEPTLSVLEQWSDRSETDDSIDVLERNVKVMKKPASPDRIVNKPPNKQPDASETDLFLLGAIEKLAYRLDFLEKRTRRLEDTMYQLLAGTSTLDNEPCPQDYSRINGNCYHISSKQQNWKTASSTCRSMGGVLLELQKEEEHVRFVASIQSIQETQGFDFWTGGLNPGLLWLWGSSAKPVVTNTTKNEIQGTGRCLLLAYLPPTRKYVYKGEDCAKKHRFICQVELTPSERRLQRLLRERRINGKPINEELVSEIRL